MKHLYERIRLAIDVSKSTPIIDALTGQSPDCWRKTDVQLELGFFFGAPELGNNFVDDISDYTAITFLLRDAETRTTTTFINKAIGAADMDPSCTYADWLAGTKQQAIIRLTSAETNLALGAISKDYWAAFLATAAGKEITLGGGKFSILENGSTAATNPAAGDPLYYTAAQVEALIATRLQAAIGGDQVFNSPNKTWTRRIGIDNNGTRIDVIKKN